MQGIRHSLITWITLLTVTSIAVTSLAQARYNGRHPAIHLQVPLSPRICIDHLYRITPCQVINNQRLNNYLTEWPPATVNSLNQLLFTLKKSRCRQPRRRQRPTLLRALFPSIPDLRLQLDRFAVKVEIPSSLNDFDLSIVHLGYRNCW